MSFSRFYNSFAVPVSRADGLLAKAMRTANASLEKEYAHLGMNYVRSVYNGIVLPFLEKLGQTPDDFDSPLEAADYLDNQWRAHADNYYQSLIYNALDMETMARIDVENQVAHTLIFHLQAQLIRQMTRLWITGVKGVPEFVSQHKIEAVLSIEHPGAPEGQGKAPVLNGPIQKIMVFWDTENGDIDGAPSYLEVVEALKFLEFHKDNNTLIHCKAGKSRSVALALAHFARSMPIPEAIDLIKQMRPNAAPNMLIIEYADRYLGFEGRLAEAVLADEDFTLRRTRLRRELKDLLKVPGLERR